ncbi:MAG: pantoate--beta-alanine ligase [Bacteroidales bacterium]|jgi:pantoate--beta-alanine ligase|nr:pantoate--beta-alanine ligase [Bacteroidales bacterium]
MIVVHAIAILQQEIAAWKQNGKTIGLVPTMGALHRGHISLVEKCRTETDCCIVSIFVNPTQFNDQMDYASYPKKFKDDSVMLKEACCDILFAPSEQEMYPAPDTRTFDFGMLDKVMEGRFRPGHFNGVAQIVSKLFQAASPDKAFFGEKDFQQLAIIRALVQQQNCPVEIVGCPIVRESEGLALSSRNARLTIKQRQIATKISQTLTKSYALVSSKTVGETIAFVTEEINAEPSLRVEYFDIVNGNTLQPVTDWNEADYIVGCTAVFCGEVRLIDNITYRKQKTLKNATPPCS